MEKTTLPQDEDNKELEKKEAFNQGTMDNTGKLHDETGVPVDGKDRPSKPNNVKDDKTVDPSSPL